MSPASGPRNEAFWTAYGKAAAGGTVEAGNDGQAKLIQVWFEKGWDARDRAPNGHQVVAKRKRKARGIRVSADTVPVGPKSFAAEDAKT
jgi:hypothetical protein